MKAHIDRLGSLVMSLALATALASLGGCHDRSSPPAASSPPTASNPPTARRAVLAEHTAEGQAVAAAMQARFDAVSDADPLNARCDGPRSPLFLCSGILLRATSEFSSNYHSWNPNPNSPKKGGVSFSYMRRDASFNKLAYSHNNGFTVWPIFHLPAGKLEMEVLCYFPMDGATDLRADFGCGAHRDHKDSGPCQDKNPPILTGAAWLADYNKAPEGESKRDQSCGFRMVSETPDSAHLFDEAMHVVHLYRGAFFDSQDEAIIATWDEGLETTLPLESFFYVAGTPGVEHAGANQQDFYDTSHGIWRPVIRMTFPNAIDGPARFEYRDEDQNVP